MKISADGRGRLSMLAELRLLVLAAMLPLLGVLAWTVHDRLQRELREGAVVAGRLARFTAADTERFLRIAEGMLEAAARHKGVTAGGRDCDPAFAAFPALAQAYGGYVIADPAGRVVCSGDLPGILRYPRGAHTYLPPERERAGFWVGSAQPDVDGGWIVPVILTLGGNGGYAGVRLHTKQFHVIVAAARLPEGASAGIMDGAGALLAHTSDNPALGAGPGLGAARAALAGQGEATLRANGEDGTELIYGFARVAGTDWVAFASLPAAPLQAALFRNGKDIALGAMAALALGLAIADLLGRRLLRPAVGAARAARRAATNPDARLPEQGPAELHFVARQFNRLLDALAADRQALEASEARLRDLLSLSADWYWEQDAEHRYTRVEGAAYEAAALYKGVIGLRRWELPGYSPLEESWEDFKARLERREAFYDVSFRQVTPAGETRYLRISGVPRHGADGAFIGYRGVAADVTRELSQRLALQASEQRYRDLFDKNHLVNLLFEPSTGRIVEASEEACALFGHSRTLLVQLGLDELGLRPRGSPMAAAACLAAATPQARELDYIGRDGKPRILEAHPGLIESEGQGLMLVSLFDITARRHAESELRKLVRAVEQSPASVVITDIQGNIEYVNAGFEAVTGYAQEEVLGKNPRILKSGLTPPAVYEELWRTIAAGGEWCGELCNRTKYGELFWEFVSISPVLDEEGNASHYVGVKENITLRKRREGEVLELNATLDRRVAERTAELERANQELDAFSYSVSHDLRAPLRAINGYVHLIEESEGGALSEKGCAHLGRIKHNALHMGELIDDMLRFARIGRGALNPRKVSLAGTAAEVVQELQELYPRTLAIVADLPEAVGDRAMLRQVFANLIGNAFKYSGKAAEPRIEVGARQEAGETVFFVRDNGAGFDMQYAQHLFGVFRRLHSEKDFPGTGVGLAIAKRIVERHGGRIWAESAPGEGATFHFTLGMQG